MLVSWHGWTKQILAPKADEARTQEELTKARRRAGPPLLWLLGKTQAGKSSIIQGITGRTDIEIGEGWRACTQASRIYDFPNEQEALIRFLDTRGIGEPFYDPAEDIAYAEEQAHGILVVMRACDPGQEIIKSVLATVRRRMPSRPVVLVQTTLHEGYPHGTGHPSEYCFAASPLPDGVPPDLARALVYQHHDFAGLFDRHVAIDFTHLDDGYAPQFYGIDALWAELAGILPAGLRTVLTRQPSLVSGLRDVLFDAAMPHIASYSLLAGVAAMVPVPLANLSGVTIAQGKMLHSIASIYDRSLVHGLTALGPALGASFLSRMVARSVVAGIPVVGTAAAGFWTATATYGLGCALCWYFAEVTRGAVPTAAQISRVYADELTRGRDRFREYFRARGDRFPDQAAAPPSRPHAP